MKLSEKYTNGLKQAYLEYGGNEEWESFERVKHGASAEELQTLRELYPEIPDSLVGLLSFADGTHFREYGDETVCMYVLGSDVEEYPYYLLSAQKMIENRNEVKEYEIFHKSIDRAWNDDEVEVDDKIIDDSNAAKWLHFSDCMNNGGTSCLFVDFTPSDKGKSGQIVRYLHDPDSLKVIADSFDDYLEMLMESEYDFINEDTL